MTKVHSNVYIPRESWPHWTWFAIEFFIVLAASLLIASEIMVTVFDDTEMGETIQNWIFWSIVGILFFMWYIILRGLVLKRTILENRYYH